MKPTTIEQSIALKIVDDLLNNLKLNGVFSEELTPMETSHELYQWADFYQIDLHNAGYTVCWGETKLVVSANSLNNWVVKFDRPHTSEDSFCNIECAYYKDACENYNVGKYLAATFYAGEVDNIKVFLQERVHPIEDQIQTSFERYCEKEFGSADVYDMDEDDRLYAVYMDAASKEDLDRLIQFVFDNEINDLHEGNYGMTKDGRIVIFDYSGFWL